MSHTIQMAEPVKVGENDHGYLFVVARVTGTTGDRWVGGAVGVGRDGVAMFFVFPEVSDGILLGMADRDEAIRLTGALAQDPEGGWGGIERWFVDGDLRGHPENYQCGRCDRVGCDGRACRDAEAFDAEDVP